MDTYPKGENSLIERYSRPPFIEYWNDENKFKKWLEVECALLEVLEKKNVIPVGTSEHIRSHAKIQVSRIMKLEKILKHDVLAFTTSISEQTKDLGRFFHYGLTSSDVVDTALSLLLKEALEYLSDDILIIQSSLKKLALRYRTLPCMGRTHGIHAEPTSFGLKFLGWYAEYERQSIRLKHAIENISYGKLSGAVGAYGVHSPDIEKEVLEKCGLKPEPVSTQVLPRDRHAEVFFVLASIGGTVERVAVELRHLQRTEVSEVEEAFTEGQKGSSAMPHKKNPIASENLTGCARLLRSYAVAALENTSLWHERDISHSSVERVITADAITLVDYMLKRLNEVLVGLKVKKDKIQENIHLTKGISFSGHVLLKLVENGLNREKAYRLVQRCAHASLDKNKNFKQELLHEKSIRQKCSKKELENIFNIQNYLKNVDRIYERVLGDDYNKKPSQKLFKR